MRISASIIISLFTFLAGACAAWAQDPPPPPDAPPVDAQAQPQPPADPNAPPPDPNAAAAPIDPATGQPIDPAAAAAAAQAAADAAAAAAAQAAAPMPTGNDPRMVQLVYNPGDVYTITTRYGYQTNIVLAPNEEIETISVGDKSMWQIIPAGTRIFIRPMEEDIMTNMTVLTNKHSYQFDIKSLGPAETEGNVYVASFLFPEDIAAQQAAAQAAAAQAAAEAAHYAALAAQPPVPAIDPNVAPPPAASAPMAPPSAPQTPLPSSIPFGGPTPPPGSPVDTTPAPIVNAMTPPAAQTPLPSNAANANYNYTYSGSDTLAPLQVFDDGKSTYLKYANLTGPLPDAYILSPDGNVVSASRSVSGEYVVVDAVVPEMILKNGNASIHVFNEALHTQ